MEVIQNNSKYYWGAITSVPGVPMYWDINISMRYVQQIIQIVYFCMALPHADWVHLASQL